MKFVLLSQWFPPEQAPIGFMLKEIAETLKNRGHEVIIITGFPNHPSGVVYNGFHKQCWFIEELNGIKIIRVYLHTSSSPSKFHRILTFISFTITSSIALLILKKVDLCFSVMQPLSIGFTLPIIAKLKRIKLVFNIQDLHPNVPIELGLIRNKIFIKLLKRIEIFGSIHADRLAVISDGFKQHSIKLGAVRSRVSVIPNWIDLDEIYPLPRNNSFRAQIGIPDDRIVLLYAGTIGLISGACILIQAFIKLQALTPNATLVFVGEGAYLAELKNFSHKHNVMNIVFLNFQSRDLLPMVQGISDISLISMSKGKGQYSIPSKVLGYMAAARPVIASVDPDSETAFLIHKSGCGVVVNPGDEDALSIEISKLIKDVKLRKSMGINGRNYLEKNLSKSKICAMYSRLLERTVLDK